MTSDKLQQTPQVQMVTVDADEAGQRVDNYLFRHLNGVPKSRIYRALRHGEVRVNKKRVKAEYRLQANDQLRVPPIRVEEREEAFVGDKLISLLEEQILYENDSLLIINKPAGLAVHGGSGLNYGLIEAVRKMRPGCKRLELAHRLDRDTSGCTIITKKAVVLRAIHQQLREKTMEKTYLALVRGRWPRRKTQVDAPLLKNELKGGERMVQVSAEGKVSKTRFGVEEVFAGATLIRAMPITGRTHQIRVHAQYAGFPLLGDDKYGKREDSDFLKKIGLKRLFLHASEVTFNLPDNNQRLTVRAPLPAELESVLQRLRDAGDTECS